MMERFAVGEIRELWAWCQRVCEVRETIFEGVEVPWRHLAWSGSPSRWVTSEVARGVSLGCAAEALLVDAGAVLG